MKEYSLICGLCGQQYSVSYATGATVGLCPLCWNKDRMRELDRIQSATYHARRDGLAADLHLSEWLAILTFYGGRCAYCQTVPFSQIDLFNMNAGLVASNVVPICRACAIHKAHSFEQAKERVREQLSLIPFIPPDTPSQTDKNTELTL